MIAVIMVGGKASRFRQPTEKAVLEVGGRTLIERAAEALNVPGAERIIAAVTSHTSRTAEVAKRLGIEVLRTDGTNYHEDILQLMDALGPFLSLNVDVPFVTKDHVSRMLHHGTEGSLTAVVPRRLATSELDRGSVMRDGSGRELIWVGLNVVTSNPEIRLVEYEDPLLAVNVNNEDDLAFAREIARKYGR